MNLENMSPKKIKDLLISTVKNMAVERTRFIRNPERDFTRNSKCDIETTANIILGFENDSLNSELKNHFRDDLKNLPYKSAFVQQRGKFSDDAFENLFRDFNAKTPFKAKKYGLHCIACDGSDVNIPKLASDKQYFVENHTKNGKGFYQFHGNAFYDLCENRYSDFLIQPRKDFNEGKAFLTMLGRAEHESDYSTLYIADRGYFSWNLAANVIESHQYFLIRARGVRSSNSAFKGLPIPDSGEFDTDISIKIIRNSSKAYKCKPGEYKCILKNSRFDFIPCGDRTTEYKMEFRMASVKLSSGEYEYLLTNLPRDKFPPDKLKELYHLRWGCETAFLKLKYNCALTSFHSVKRDFIIQEVYARLIMYNFTSLIASVVKIKDNPKFKHEHKISFANAAKTSRMYFKINMSVETLETLIRKYIIPIRGDRRYERNVRSQTVLPLNTRV
jgi:hypothetical protein